ncbi:MAG: hypothetical protein JXJ19_01975 [Elusimicrobia bacterium]|nr:hypothetical protein [Elusimicrobiota bacterium]
MPRVKISGITNTEDAKWAAIHGVEFISVSLEEGAPKKVSLERALEVMGLLPSYTAKIADFGEISGVNQKVLKKVKSDYIQFRDTQLKDAGLIREKLAGYEGGLILEAAAGSDIPDYGDLEISFIQFNVPPDIDEDSMRIIAEKHDMEKIIIQGDFGLDRIKKQCEILKPHAWSVDSVIEKSPRKIDYPRMKEYIREISLL